LAAGATAATIAAAPAAVADFTPNQTCTSLGGTQTQRQMPGNVQINDAPPQVNYFPLRDD
jgi:hypothetical protein